MADYLKRYTELPFLFDFLMTKELALLDPKSWDDRNDSFYINQYLLKTRRNSAYALCLTQASETYHHWRVFSTGSSGVCIEFDRERFNEAVDRDGSVIASRVDYRMIDTLEKNPPSDEELPFLKRYAFKDEREYRLFKADESDDILYRMKMPLSAVRRIIISPWIPKPVGENVKSIIRGIEGCTELKLTRSTLVENARWKKIAEC